MRSSKGFFSKGSIVSRFPLQGDFDVQVDAEMRPETGALEMDHVAFAALREAGKSHDEANITVIQFHRAMSAEKGMLFAAYRMGSMFRRGKTLLSNDFSGSLRFVRKGVTVKTFVRQKDAEDWTYFNTFPCAKGPLEFIMGVSNFLPTTAAINATASVETRFDNFRIKQLAITPSLTPKSVK